MKRTTPADPDFPGLVRELDIYLAALDGEEAPFYAQFNTSASLQHVVILYQDNIPAGCGAIKQFDEESMEIKRMYIRPAYRRQGYAASVLRELETWSAELGYRKTILETGHQQAAAIRLYENAGYVRITNFGPYEGVENSRCFEKNIHAC